MRRKEPRGLKQEEIELWRKVVEHAVPLKTMPVSIPPAERAAPKKSARPGDPGTLKPFQIGSAARPAPSSHSLAPDLSAHLARQPLAMDSKRFGQMKKGRLSPEARIDLHGMTISQAHTELTRFIFTAVSEGRRLVLVITGKGKSRPDTGVIPERHGALRHQVPHWLHSAPLKPHVLQLTEAHLRHGGQGAYYVYLRRTR